MKPRRSAGGVSCFSGESRLTRSGRVALAPSRGPTMLRMPDEPSPHQPILSPDGRHRWDGRSWVPVEQAPPAQHPYGTPPQSGAGTPYAPENPYAAALIGAPQGAFAPGGSAAGGAAPGLGWGWLTALSPLLTLSFLIPLGWMTGSVPDSEDPSESQLLLLGSFLILGYLAGALLALIGALVDRERLRTHGITVGITWPLLAGLIWPIGSIGYLVVRVRRAGRGAAGVITWPLLVVGIFFTAVVLAAVASTDAPKATPDATAVEENLVRVIGERADTDDVTADCPDDATYEVGAEITCTAVVDGEELDVEVELRDGGEFRWETVPREGRYQES